MNLRIFFICCYYEHIFLKCVYIQHLNVYYTCFDLGETKIYSLKIMFAYKSIECLLPVESSWCYVCCSISLKIFVWNFKLGIMGKKGKLLLLMSAAWPIAPYFYTFIQKKFNYYKNCLGIILKPIFSRLYVSKCNGSYKKKTIELIASFIYKKLFYKKLWETIICWWKMAFFITIFVQGTSKKDFWGWHSLKKKELSYEKNVVFIDFGMYFSLKRWNNQ